MFPDPVRQRRLSAETAVDPSEIGLVDAYDTQSTPVPPRFRCNVRERRFHLQNAVEKFDFWGRIGRVIASGETTAPLPPLRFRWNSETAGEGGVAS